MATNNVQAQGITKTFGKRQVVEGIHLNVPQGSVLALLGPNGAGKTTTVRILTTLLKPDSGSITIAGYGVLREPDKARSVIGVAGQSVSVDGYLSGLENLMLIGRLYRFSGKDAERRAQELIEQFELTEAAHRSVLTYSGGMIDRFRSLPMVTSAILGGTVLSVAVRSLLSVTAMVLVGLLVGFRPQADFGAWLAAIGLLLLVAYASSWLFAVFALMSKSIEGAQQVSGFVWPLFFLSSAFVPVQTMPALLQGFANNQPLTQAINAIRALLLVHPVGNHAWITVAWCIGIIFVSVPLAGMLFRRKFS